MTDATTLTGTLTARARAVLACGDATEKAALAAALGRDAAAGAVPEIGVAGAPDRPARPARPELRAPRDMPRRRAGKSAAGRDRAPARARPHRAQRHRPRLRHRRALRARRGNLALRRARPAARVLRRLDRGRRRGGQTFSGAAARLTDFGAAYGDLPAHDGLWEAAENTADDLLARLAVVPLVLEARGLDVTPVMIERMTRFGDAETAALLTTIYRDEIGHVATGRKWFGRIARGARARAARGVAGAGRGPLPRRLEAAVQRSGARGSGFRRRLVRRASGEEVRTHGSPPHPSLSPSRGRGLRRVGTACAYPELGEVDVRIARKPSQSRSATLAVVPATRWLSEAAMKSSRSPSSTPCALPFSTPVRRSFTIW